MLACKSCISDYSRSGRSFGALGGSTRMKIRTIRVVGIALIVAAAATGIGLQLSGTDLFHFHGEGGQLPTRVEIGLHWSAFVLLAVAFSGLLCLVLSTRRAATPTKLPVTDDDPAA